MSIAAEGPAKGGSAKGKGDGHAAHSTMVGSKDGENTDRSLTIRTSAATSVRSVRLLSPMGTLTMPNKGPNDILPFTFKQPHSVHGRASVDNNGNGSSSVQGTDPDRPQSSLPGVSWPSLSNTLQPSSHISLSRRPPSQGLFSPPALSASQSPELPPSYPRGKGKVCLQITASCPPPGKSRHAWLSDTVLSRAGGSKSMPLKR